MGMEREGQRGNNWCKTRWSWERSTQGGFRELSTNQQRDQQVLSVQDTEKPLRKPQHLPDTKMWHWGTWSRGGLGSVRFTFGLDLKGLFQPQWFHDSKPNKNNMGKSHKLKTTQKEAEEHTGPFWELGHRLKQLAELVKKSFKRNKGNFYRGLSDLITIVSRKIATTKLPWT